MGESGLTVLRVISRVPLIMDESGLRDLFIQAFADDWMPDGEDAWAWCGAYVEDPSIGVFVVRDEDMKWVGLAVTDFSESVWSPDPMVLSLWSSGRLAMEALLGEIRKWSLSMGKKTIRFANVTRHSDESYARLVRKFADAENFGTLMKADWKVDDGIWIR